MKSPALLALALCASLSAAKPVTYHQDVAPILRDHCQSCHRPGEAAPMPLLTYTQVRPWAASIKEAVTLKRMPPWFADPHVGKFANDRSLAAADIAIIQHWVEAGAPEGDARSLASPAKFIEGWNIATPDRILEMPVDFQVPASGTLDYQYILVPGGFTEDKWVQMAEVRPGNRAVLHHVIAYVRAPGSNWMKDAQPGIPFVPAKGSGGKEGEFLIGYAPGGLPEILEPGRAKLIRAGSDIIFELHYTTNGKPATDRTRIGLVFAKQPPRERVITLAASNGRFVIPPGAPNHTVESRFEFAAPAKIISLIPHMHLRGKDFEYRIKYPDGRVEPLLKVPNYSFAWQIGYRLAQDLEVPAGAIVECTAHFDNSANNPNNPDPTKEVREGRQSWEEMMIGFFEAAIDPKLDFKDVIARPGARGRSSE